MFKFHIQDLKLISAAYSNTCDFYIETCATLDELRNNALIFVKKKPSAELISKLEKLQQCLLILPPESENAYAQIKINNFVIATENPRLTFAQIFQFALDSSGTKSEVPAVLGKNVRRGANVSIGCGTVISDNVRLDNNVVIGENVFIGENCRIMAGAIINDNVSIGEKSIIREHAVIGGWGYGFERDERGIPIRLPHVGGVKIGCEVEVGALSTIASGTFKPTIIGDYTKLDDHVHIAHNCRVGVANVFVAFSGIAGSVTIGDRCWIGLHAAVIQGTKIGSDCFVGMGAVVKKNLRDGVTVSDNPAQTLEELALKRKIYHRLKKNFAD